jgi:hypothetical protein
VSTRDRNLIRFWERRHSIGVLLRPCLRTRRCDEWYWRLHRVQEMRASPRCSRLNAIARIGSGVCETSMMLFLLRSDL